MYAIRHGCMNEYMYTYEHTYKNIYTSGHCNRHIALCMYIAIRKHVFGRNYALFSIKHGHKKIPAHRRYIHGINGDDTR